MRRLMSIGLFGLYLTPLCLAQETSAPAGTAAAGHTVVVRAHALIDFNKALEVDPSHPEALAMMKKTYETLKSTTPQ